MGRRIKKRRIKNKNLISKIFGIVTVVLVFFPYINIDGQYHTILYLLKTLNSVDINEFVTVNHIYTDNPEALKLMMSAQIYALCMVAVLGMIKTILAFCNKRENIVCRYLYFALCVAVLFFDYVGYGLKEIPSEMWAILFPVFPFIWGVIVFIVEAYYSQVKEEK